MGGIHSLGFEKFKILGRACLDFVYPPFCFFCDQRLSGEELFICTDCWSNLPVLKSTLAKPENSGKYHFIEALAVWEYGDNVDIIIHHFKYYGKTKIGRVLGRKMGTLADEIPGYANSDCLIPVPLHRRKYRERGFNQSRILADAVGKVLNIPVLCNVLKRIRYTKPQASLNKTKRAKNVANAFKVVDLKAVSEKQVILIDDVFTTGSTLNVCAKELLQAGAAKVRVLTVARA